MLLPWSALSGCGDGCPCGPCSRPTAIMVPSAMHGLGASIPPVQVRPKYAGQNPGESDDAFFARMRASQQQASQRSQAPAQGGSGKLGQGVNVADRIKERQDARLTPDQLVQMAQQGIGIVGGGGGAAAAAGEAAGEGSFLTSAGFLLPVAVGGAGAAAGSLLYHAPSSLDRERSSRTIKRKELQSTATAAVGGAASGAAIGTLIFPGIGTAIGAVVGGAGGAVAGLLNGKKLKKKNKKLAQQAAYEAAAEQQRLSDEQQAALDAQREYQAEVTNLRLDMEAKIREANRWALAVRQLRGDEASARALLTEMGQLRAALMSETDLDTMDLLMDQAEESVEDMRALAEVAREAARPAGRSGGGLSGLAEVDSYVLETRRRNRAALGLPPQDDTPSGMSTEAKVLLGVGVLGLGQWLYWRSKRR